MKVILGGGLSGLSAAHYLLKRFPKDEIIILESTNRVGGWIKSSINDNGTLLEQGPRTIRPRGNFANNTLQLIEELNICNKVIDIPLKHTAALNRMIYVNNRLHNLPSSISGLLKTQSPFTKPLISYILKDLFIKKSAKEDESIYDFVHRRFGKEIADYAISSMICGICAGNAKDISVKFLMELPFNREQKYGSVIKGYIYNLFQKNELKNIASTKFIEKSKYWSIYSLEGGLETLPLTLKQSLEERGVKIMLNTPCKQIKFKNDGSVCLETENNKFECEKVVSSLPSPNLAKLIENQHPNLSKLLSEIPYVTVVVVNLEFASKLIKQEGFGFLVPPCENRPLLGVIYDSCCFPNGDRTILTAMLGGYCFNKYFSADTKEEHFLKTALMEIKHILGIDCAPTFHKVHFLRDCIPQYTIGHSKRVHSIEEYIAQRHLPLSVCGSAFHGIGINDVINTAKAAVHNM